MEEDRDWVRKQLEDNVPPGDIEEQLISRGYGIEEATSLVEQVQEGMEDTTYEEGEGKRQPDTNEAEDTARMLSPGIQGIGHIMIHLLALVAAIFNTLRGNYWLHPHVGIIVMAVTGIAMELLGVDLQRFGGVSFWGREYHIRSSKLPYFVAISIAYILYTLIDVVILFTGMPSQIQWLFEEMMLT
ncbi:MAG: hypothetical protein SVU32_02630 [Candidatus Nanohaloarchaea archaeon]|nr:hypothetical protein [Candidatus Nanohaloarchaea archaeon]